MATEIKICGLRTTEAVEAVLEAGADIIAFNFYPRSPRSVSVAEAAILAEPARGRVQIVALTVDADDATLEAIAEGLRPDLWQVHGQETPARIAALRQRFGIPVIKAVKIATADDLAILTDYVPVVDRLLFDAKPAPDHAGALPGGNGLPFDWRLIAGLAPGRPTMLSGGLTPHNVADAIAMTGIGAVDVASGVERRPGEKDPALIRAFIAAVRSVS